MYICFIIKPNVMTAYKILSEELMIQEVKTGLIEGKKYNTIADEVVGKWCVMIQLNNGFVGVGIDLTKQNAKAKAIEEARNI